MISLTFSQTAFPSPTAVKQLNNKLIEINLYYQGLFKATSFHPSELYEQSIISKLEACIQNWENCTPAEKTKIRNAQIFQTLCEQLSSILQFSENYCFTKMHSFGNFNHVVLQFLSL